jgi:4-amino-4-deoxy-L-arabinose transferase-like glycosyltransferase
VKSRAYRIVTSPLFICLAAFLFRGISAWNYQSHLPRQALRAIPFLFESGNIAVSLATGHGFASPFRVDTGPTAWMTPIYPLLLSAIMKIFGVYTFASWVAAVSFNIVVSSLACFPLFFAARRIGGAALAILATWLWAIFPNAILLSHESLWDTSLSAFLAALLLWATLSICQSSKKRDWIAYGLLCGVALMTNAAILSVLAIVIGWAVWRTRAFREAAFAVLVIVLCCVPWSLRNYAVFHAFIPLRSILGLQLWVGNNPQAHVVWKGEQHPIREEAERNRYVEMGEIAYMREKYSNATAYIFTHPAHEAELISGRFVSLWAGGATSPVHDFFANQSAWFRYVLLFNLAGAFASLAGAILLLLRRHPFAVPLAAYPLIFPCAYYMTLSFPRYRHLIDPVVMLFLAMAILTLFRRSIPHPEPSAPVAVDPSSQTEPHRSRPFSPPRQIPRHRP